MSGVVPEKLPLSPGAERVVSALRRADGVCAASGFGILDALWRDESRGAEILKAAGFDPTSAGKPMDGSIQGDVLPAVLHAARRNAARAGEGEIGTEHLLTALLEVDPDTWNLVPGIDLHRLRAADDSATATEEPLDFDEELCPGAGVSPPSPEPLSTHRSPLTHSPPPGAATDTRRILDAAANRGREGLRVVEDFVRFQLDDAHLSGLLKTVRHELADALLRLGSDAWHRQRDTPGDVGTAVTTARESARGSLEDVLRANCKRVEESLRSLEEFGKLIDVAAAGAIEQLRYRVYTIEKAVLTTVSSCARLADCRLYLLVGEADCPRGIERTIREALAGGVDIVQLREKSGDDGQFVDLARKVRRWTRDAGALFIVNDRPDIAVLSDADGVHVGQGDLPCRDARRIVGGDRLVGVSTHSIEEARRAVLDGADYIGVGPVFPSATKEFAQLAGLEYVRQVAGEISLPWFAIGGITLENMGEVLNAGARQVAVCGAVCGAKDVKGATRQLRDVLGRQSQTCDSTESSRGS